MTCGVATVPERERWFAFANDSESDTTPLCTSNRQNVLNGANATAIQIVAIVRTLGIDEHCPLVPVLRRVLSVRFVHSEFSRPSL